MDHYLKKLQDIYTKLEGHPFLLARRKPMKRVYYSAKPGLGLNAALPQHTTAVFNDV